MCAHTCLCMCVCVSVCMCAQVLMYMWVHACMYTCIHVVCVHVCFCAHVTSVRVCVHTCVDIFTNWDGEEPAGSETSWVLRGIPLPQSSNSLGPGRVAGLLNIHPSLVARELLEDSTQSSHSRLPGVQPLCPLPLHTPPPSHHPYS